MPSWWLNLVSCTRNFVGRFTDVSFWMSYLLWELWQVDLLEKIVIDFEIGRGPGRVRGHKKKNGVINCHFREDIRENDSLCFYVHLNILIFAVLSLSPSPNFLSLTLSYMGLGWWLWWLFLSFFEGFSKGHLA